MKNMNLYQIAAACKGQLVLPSFTDSGKPGYGVGEADVTVTADTEVTSAVIDSRQVTEGALFFAVPGERVDGHKFIGSAYEKGAYCVVTRKTPQQVETEHGVAADSWGAYILVEDTLSALKEIAAYYRSTLNIPFVGITGSVGKTSTKEFIAGVLSEKYHVLKTEGNFNNEIGVPLTILRIRKEHQAAVVEMGISEFGEMSRLSRIVRPNVCVITNIGQCHLENLKTRDGILKAKTEIFDYMAEDAQVCLNGDDDKLKTVTQVKGRPVHFFGLGDDTGKEVYATDVVSKGLFGSEAVLHMKGDAAGTATGAVSGCASDISSAAARQEITLPVKVSLPGIHMVANAAAAACVGQLLGLSQEQIAEGIRKVEPVSGRSHLISLEKYTLIDDCYNANPVSMRAALDLLNMADNQKIAILGDMFELGADSDRMHRQTGEYAATAGIDRIICIGENARHMYEGACEAGGRECVYFATKGDFLEAYRMEQEELLPADSTILIKASHGMEFAQIVKILEQCI